jgi:hypothetical protein
MVVFRAEEQNHLQLTEREEMDGEDDLFEAIEKCKIQIISSLSITDCFLYRFLLAPRPSCS